MKQYIIRRLLNMIPIMLGITILIFFLLKLSPGDPLTMQMNPKMSIETKEALREKYGFNDPVYVQYFKWLGRAVRLDLGESIQFAQPVTKVLNTYIWNTFLLAITSLILTYLIAIPLGIISATKQYSGFDIFVTVFALVGISMPVFFFALIMIKFFSVDLRILPISGMRTVGVEFTGIGQVLDIIKHMILPLVVYTLSGLAGLMKFTRSSMLEVIRQDYIRTARAKGLKEKVVIYKHAFRNALIPIVTFLGYALAGLFVGGIISEQIFVWPGIGKIYYQAINNRDYNLIIGYNVIIAFLVLIGNLIADVMYAVVDPRIRLS